MIFINIYDFHENYMIFMKTYGFHAKPPKLAAKPLKPAAKPPEVAAKPLDVRIASKPDSKIMYDIALTVQDPCSVQLQGALFELYLYSYRSPK